MVPKPIALSIALTREPLPLRRELLGKEKKREKEFSAESSMRTEMVFHNLLRVGAWLLFFDHSMCSRECLTEDEGEVPQPVQQPP